jgi:transcriptional regulator with XRE-family HTH domain
MNTVKIAYLRPRAFTSAEKLIESVRSRVLTDGRSYKEIATATGVAGSTIGNLATGKTRWPRPTTLFPLLSALGLHIELVDDR